MKSNRIGANAPYSQRLFGSQSQPYILGMDYLANLANVSIDERTSRLPHLMTLPLHQDDRQRLTKNLQA